MPIQVMVSLSRMRMKSWGALLLPLVVLGVMLAFAPSAFAATFVVNNTADTADPAINGSCDTDGGTDDTPCTLRAAIQESNANGGAVVDAIDFNTGAMGVDPTI